MELNQYGFLMVKLLLLKMVNLQEEKNKNKKLKKN
jgi:hypothetical protein